MNPNQPKRVERTPGSILPLVVGRLDRGHGHYSYAVMDATGKPIAEGFTEPEIPELIVRAVNAHDRLVEACKELMGWIEELAASGDAGWFSVDNIEEYFQAKAALALATVDPDDPATLAKTADAVESGDLEGGAA